MRVLFLYMFPLWGNGSGTFLRLLLDGLQEKGHDVAIVSPDRNDLSVKAYKVSPPQMGVFIGHPRLPHAKKFQEMSPSELDEMIAHYRKKIFYAIDDFKPDVIHVSHTFILTLIGAEIKKTHGINFLVSSYGSDLEYLEEDSRYKKAVKMACESASFITVVGEFTEAHFLRIFGSQFKEKVSILYPFGADEDEVKDFSEEIKMINQKYSLSNENVALYVGRLVEEKGVKYLIDAARSINGKVIIIGDGPDRENIQRQIIENRLSNVIVVGALYKNSKPSSYTFYKRADVFVSPSIWDESFGISILEAMMHQTPVIATQKGGVNSIIQNGTDGLLIKPKDSKELANKINLLFGDDKLRITLGKNGYETAVKKFTKGGLISQFEAIALASFT